MKSEAFRNNHLFLRNQFKADGFAEIPIIQKESVNLEKVSLIGFDKTKYKDEKNTNSIVHFFLDDYKFEAFWKNPEKQIEKLSQYRAVLSPQFSTYTEMPLAIQIYQTFKNRWCGAYMQAKGITVIPSLAWGESDTYLFAFDGIQKGSIVAVSTIGVRTEKNLFLQGYNYMLMKIKPHAIICYGKPFSEMKGNIITVDYAETNHLGTKSNNNTQADIRPCIKYFCGYVTSDKGMGGAGGGFPKFPENDSQIKHIFRNKSGHLPDTPENRTLLRSVAESKDNYIGTDTHGNKWYAKTLEDGRQVWVSVHNSTITNAGANSIPRDFDPETGLNQNPKMNNTWRKRK